MGLGRLLLPTQLQMESARSILVEGPLQDHLLRARSSLELAARNLPIPLSLQTRQTARSPRLKISTRLTACVPRVSRPNLPFAPLDAFSPTPAVDLLISQRSVPTKMTKMLSAKARPTTWLIGTT